MTNDWKKKGEEIWYEKKKEKWNSALRKCCRVPKWQSYNYQKQWFKNSTKNATYNLLCPIYKIFNLS